MQNLVRALIVCMVTAGIVGCGGPEDKQGKSLKVGEVYVMTKEGLERMPVPRDKQGEPVQVGRTYLMTPAGLEPVPYLRDKSGNKAEIGNEYIVTPDGLKLVHSRTIRGTILDNDGKAVQGVQVVVAQSDYQSTTGSNGTFTLPFVEGYVRLILKAPNLPDWCRLEEIQSVFLSREQYPDGWDVGTVKLPCVQVGTKGDKTMWATADQTYVDNADGTVTDLKHGLMWEAQVKEHDVAWSKAVEYAENLNLAGRSDWRLPTPEELETLYESRAACAWQSPALISGAITLWSAQQKGPDSALIYNVCTGKGRDSHGLDEGQGGNPSALAVRDSK